MPGIQFLGATISSSSMDNDLLSNLNFGLLQVKECAPTTLLCRKYAAFLCKSEMPIFTMCRSWEDLPLLSWFSSYSAAASEEILQKFQGVKVSNETSPHLIFCPTGFLSSHCNKAQSDFLIISPSNLGRFKRLLCSSEALSPFHLLQNKSHTQ